MFHHIPKITNSKHHNFPLAVSTAEEPRRKTGYPGGRWIRQGRYFGAQGPGLEIGAVRGPWLGRAAKTLFRDGKIGKMEEKRIVFIYIYMIYIYDI